MDINFIDINKPQTDDEEEEEEDPNRADPLAVDPLELDPIKMEPEDEAVLKTEEVHFDDVHPDFIIKTENFEDDEDCQNKEGVEAGDPTFVEDPLAINPPDENQVQTQPQPKPLQIMFVPVMMNNNVGGQVVTPVGQVVTPSGQNQQKLLVTTGGSIANSPNVNVPITGYQPSLRESRIRKVRDPTIDTTINYPCGICKKTFYIEEAVIKHREEKHATQMNKLERNKCYLCGKVFDKLNLLVLHIKEHMLEKECKVCNLVFETPELFKAHALATHMKYNYKCSVCLKTFEKESGLRCHMTVMHSAATSSSEANAFICKICGKGFMSEDLLNLHDLNIHKTSTVLSTSGQGPVTPSAVPNAITSVQGAIMPNVITSVQGAVVPTILPNLQGIVAPNIQGNVISTGPEANKMCNDLNVVPTRDSELDLTVVDDSSSGGGSDSEGGVSEGDIEHIVIKNEEYMEESGNKGRRNKMDVDIDYFASIIYQIEVDTCPVCGRRYRNAKSLRKHFKRHSGNHECEVCHKVFREKRKFTRHKLVHVAKREHLCDVCSKTFKDKHALVQHKIIHLGVKRYSCNLCDKAYTQNSKLKLHMQAKHSEKEAKLSCSLCDKTFVWQASLKTHMLRHANSRTHKCQVCQKGFINKYTLNIHMLSHTDERRYSCKVCSKKFKTSSHLSYHMQTHTGVRNYKCDICEKSFARRGSLRMHYRIHTEERGFVCKVCDRPFSQSSHLHTHIRLVHPNLDPEQLNVRGSREKSELAILP